MLLICFGCDSSEPSGRGQKDILVIQNVCIVKGKHVHLLESLVCLHYIGIEHSQVLTVSTKLKVQPITLNYLPGLPVTQWWNVILCFNDTQSLCAWIERRMNEDRKYVSKTFHILK